MTVQLNKPQREFFLKFAQSAVSGVLFPALESKGFVVPAEMRETVINGLKLDDLRDAIAQHFLANVDFNTLQKVDKFMRSEDYAKVANASAEVFVAVEKELLEIVIPMIPSDEVVADLMAQEAERQAAEGEVVPE